MRYNALLDAIGYLLIFAAAYSAAPWLSRRIGAPLITVHLVLGLATQLLLGVHMPHTFGPAHNAALACITIAAGAELVVSQLRRNARAIAWLFVCFNSQR